MNEQLKQAIENKFPKYDDPLRDFNSVNAQRVVGAKICLQDPSILRHADPEIMKQAGWVREDEHPFKGFTVADMKRAMEFAAIKGWNLELGVSAKFAERNKMIENYIKSIIVTN